MEKFIKNFSNLGKLLDTSMSEVYTYTTMINSETDLRIFIDENRTNTDFIEKEEFKTYS